MWPLFGLVWCAFRMHFRRSNLELDLADSPCLATRLTTGLVVYLGGSPRLFLR